ncbi:MAG TPA: hypothetical protein VHQ47_07230 [Phycisphaerae bacterium]|nr:hypothetical protein [Phycisphaerae bacterium]
MSLVFVTRTETRSGPVIPFICPKCGQGVEGESTESIERTRLWGFIPILKFKNAFVACPSCGVRFTLALPIDRLAELQPAARGALVVSGAPKRAKILAIAACLVFWVPIVGVLVAGMAAFFARGSKGWAKWTAMICLLLAIAVTSCVAMLMFK